MGLVVRTTNDPLDSASTLRRTIWEIDNRVTIRNIYSMKQLVGRSVAEPRFRTLILTLLAGIAVLLSMVGVYGVIAHLVVQGAGEIGVRMALGARQVDVVHHVMRRGLLLSSSGVLIGLAIASAVARLLDRYLFEVSVTDPVTFTIVGFVVIAVGAFASGIPAWRAAQIDPIRVLRTE
jgi:ABC-type antimicrobial peptide transport system permease subunit